MAGKGPGPLKSASARRNKAANNASPGFKTLPHDGPTTPAPEWPLPELTYDDDPKIAEAEKKEWERVWRLPQAYEWERMQCEPLVALYVRVFVKAARTGDQKLLNEMRQLDSKLGLSPRAMMDLRWETDEASYEEETVKPVKAADRIFVPKQAAAT